MTYPPSLLYRHKNTGNGRSVIGKINEHNSWIPRDIWLDDWEKKVILDYYVLHCDEGYCSLAFMVLDEYIVAVSPSSVHRVLFEACVMRKWKRKPI